MKRLFDIVFSAAFLIAASPILLFCAIGIKISSPGPILYPAIRVGRGNASFTMYKFRTMGIANEGAVITAQNDPRIFRCGKILRKTKLDEFPQFINVLMGQMSVVGPRPEDPKIVNESYTDWMLETLSVRPGITSPGAVFYYAYGESLIDPDAPEASYVDTLLPPKLAIERGYIDRATFPRDLKVICYTAAAVFGEVIGFQVKPPRADIEAATPWIKDADFTKTF